MTTNHYYYSPYSYHPPLNFFQNYEQFLLPPNTQSQEDIAESGPPQYAVNWDASNNSNYMPENFQKTSLVVTELLAPSVERIECERKRVERRNFQNANIISTLSPNAIVRDKSSQFTFPETVSDRTNAPLQYNTLLFQFIDPQADVSCDFCHVNITAKRRRNRIYVLLNAEQNHLLCGHSVCLLKKGYFPRSEKVKNFIKNLFSSLDSRPNPLIWMRQLYLADMLGNELITQKELSPILKKLMEDTAPLSFNEILKDSHHIASAQLILYAHQHKVLNSEETLFYLRKIYKQIDQNTIGILRSYNQRIIYGFNCVFPTIKESENIRPSKKRKKETSEISE